MEVQHSLPNVPVYLVGSKLDLEADSSLSEAAVQVGQETVAADSTLGTSFSQCLTAVRMQSLRVCVL